MRIAQVAPLYESVPPSHYGGTERIVSYLTEELVREGHEVTLFASGDSDTTARLVPCCERALRLDSAVVDATPYHMIMLDRLLARADAFDLVHFHIDLFQFPLMRQLAVPAVTTLHGRLDLPDLLPFYRRFSQSPLVSISLSQRVPMPEVNWVGVVHHGLPRELLPFSATPAGHLAFLGRISPEKGPEAAIAIAERAGLRLRIAAKVDPVDQAYWDMVVAPMIAAHPHVDYLGEIDDDAKGRLLGDSAALLVPIDWPEPFGLVMIEAMACGTPVIAFRAGSVPEVIEDGVTGFIVEGVAGAVAALEKIATLDRHRIRSVFEARFTAERMAHDYLAIYATLVAQTPHATGPYPPGLPRAV